MSDKPLSTRAVKKSSSRSSSVFGACIDRPAGRKGRSLPQNARTMIDGLGSGQVLRISPTAFSARPSRPSHPWDYCISSRRFVIGSRNLASP